MSFILVTFLALVRCGQPVCVAGIGDCNFKDVKSVQSGSSGGKLTMTANTASAMKVTETKEITVSGGAPGDITVTVLQGGGTLSNSGKVSSGKIVYTPPSSVASGGITVRIVARDSVYKDDASDPEHYHWVTLSFDVTN